MSAADHSDDHPSITSLIGFGLSLVALYVLSPGAVIILMHQGFVPDLLLKAIHVLYWPLEWLYLHIECVHAFYNWYFEICLRPFV